MRKPVTSAQRDEIIALKDQGLLPKQIAPRVGLHPATVSKVLKGYREVVATIYDQWGPCQP